MLAEGCREKMHSGRRVEPAQSLAVWVYCCFIQLRHDLLQEVPAVVSVSCDRYGMDQLERDPRLSQSNVQTDGGQ